MADSCVRRSCQDGLTGCPCFNVGDGSDPSVYPCADEADECVRTLYGDQCLPKKDCRSALGCQCDDQNPCDAPGICGLDARCALPECPGLYCSFAFYFLILNIYISLQNNIEQHRHLVAVVPHWAIALNLYRALQENASNQAVTDNWLVLAAKFVFFVVFVFLKNNSQIHFVFIRMVLLMIKNLMII